MILLYLLALIISLSFGSYYFITNLLNIILKSIIDCIIIKLSYA